MGTPFEVWYFSWYQYQAVQLRLKSSGWFKYPHFTSLFPRKGNSFLCDLEKGHVTSIGRLGIGPYDDLRGACFHPKMEKSRQIGSFFTPGQKFKERKIVLKCRAFFGRDLSNFRISPKYWSGKNLPSVKVEKSWRPKMFLPKGLKFSRSNGVRGS